MMDHRNEPTLIIHCVRGLLMALAICSALLLLTTAIMYFQSYCTGDYWWFHSRYSAGIGSARGQVAFQFQRSEIPPTPSGFEHVQDNASRSLIEQMKVLRRLGGYVASWYGFGVAKYHSGSKHIFVLIAPTPAIATAGALCFYWSVRRFHRLTHWSMTRGFTVVETRTKAK
jgi:hypothetical protein